MSEEKDNGMFFISGRVSFPHLFTKPVINGDEGKYGGSIILESDGKSRKKVDAEIAKIIKDKFKGKKLPSDKLCLRDGDDKGREEYEGTWVISCNSNKRPVVLSRTKEIITSEDDNEIYGGCYVNAKVRLWAQDNNFGKRVNCELIAIQFAKDGEALSAGHVSANDAMDGFGEVEYDEDEMFG